jgi:hypothetical protein
MTTTADGFTTRVPVAAVRCVLIAMAMAAYTDPALAQTAEELTKPSSTVELGVGNVSNGSYKAGEYNGLQKKGAFLIGDVDFRGGGAYDSGSAMRYRAA